MSAPHAAGHPAPHAAPYGPAPYAPAPSVPALGVPAPFVPAPRVTGPAGAPVAYGGWAPPPLPPPLPPPHTIEPPAGLADVRELGEPWASTAAATAGAIAMGAVGNAFTPSAMGYAPPASYRVPAPRPGAPVPYPAARPTPVAPIGQPVPATVVPAPRSGPVDARVPAPRAATSPRTPLRPTLPAVALT